MNFNLLYENTGASQSAATVRIDSSRLGADGISTLLNQDAGSRPVTHHPTEPTLRD